jgi:glyoxylase-like metal-dependent hydrolase (beta-lactamase superfamily II)
VERTVRQEQQPAEPEILEVAPGVLRLQLPISMPGLGHVNCYALPDERGVTLVDPGLPGPASWRTLTERMANAELRVRDVHTVVVTHAHPDHFGNAGRLAEEAGAELVTHSAFRTWWSPQVGDPCDDVADVDPEDLPEQNPFGGTTPWGGQGFRPPFRRRMIMKLMRTKMLNIYAAPKPTRRVRNGDIMKLGRREWTVVHTPGHTLDHLCLHDEENGVFLSGDHVLPTITPHISGLGAGRDPLRSFVDSLDRVATLAGVRTVLPAHGQPFTDLAGRAGDIKRHHDERVEKLRAISLALGPATVEDLSHELFSQRAWGPMAESETYAHLEHLRLAGQADRDERPDGKMIFRVHPVTP